ncbi:hypothetical protein WHR41_06520 [Cladosporium halotolerans]|uniref:Uncharacterized protein n=1 Tax=Cladosporium halotolerans TaxID=1052096 RepID=A0AB34KK28_9PEZI
MDAQEQTPPPCRLLSLPAELRLRIYSFALAPTGTLYLHRTPSKRHAVTPSISPALLATNRQIHSEAASTLYVENTVHIAVDAHDTAWPAINEARLPQRVLGKLERLCVLLDCTAVLWRGYDTVDFEAFTALTALRRLRLRALVLPDVEEREEGEDEDEDGDGDGGDGGFGVTEPANPTRKFPGFFRLATEILERVPAGTKVFYGPPAADEGDIGVSELQDGPQAPFDEFYTPKYKTATLPGQERKALAREVSETDLLESMRAVDLEGRRGCKAGTVKDVWGDYRAMLNRGAGKRI